jgi:hypothetical protein
MKLDKLVEVMGLDNVSLGLYKEPNIDHLLDNIFKVYEKKGE